MDWLSVVYAGCFVFGLVFIIAAFLWTTGSSPTPSAPTNWFNFNAFVIAVTWFGGTGFVLRSFGLNMWLTLPLAVAVGTAGYIMSRRSGQLWSSNAGLPDYKTLVGLPARVASPTLDAASGTIVGSKDGHRWQLEARGLGFTNLSEGAHVVIVRIEDGIAYVADLNEVLSKAGAEKWVRQEF